MMKIHACAVLEHSAEATSKQLSSFVDDLVKAHGRRGLSDSMNIEAARLVQEMDLLDESEDEGEVMLLAMILLQLHGVRFQDTSIMSADDHNKKKRQRTSPEQLAILEQIFQTDKMPSQQTRVQLADQLGMSSRRVQIWFQNKRAKVKRGGIGRSSDDLQPPSPSDCDESGVPENDESPLSAQNELLSSSEGEADVPTMSPKRRALERSQQSSSSASQRNMTPFPFSVSSFEAPPILVNFSH